MLEVGREILGRYRVRRLLGKGGMGQVYLAQDLKLAREVAVKVLSLNDKELAKRFEREAQFMAKVHHPNVVTIFDLGTVDEQPTIVMEFVKGITLEERIAQGRLEWREAFKIAISLLSGLSSIHRDGIVHRDLKPANIVLMSGRPVIPKILDFGVARTLFSDDTKLTQTGFVMGTPAYMSPEQLIGMPVEKSLDLYAIGLMVYEMLTQKIPFGRDRAGIFRRLKEVVPPVRLEGVTIPADAQEVLSAILEVDADQRPPDADALAALFTKALETPQTSREAPTLEVSFAPAPMELPLAAITPLATKHASSTLLFIARLPPSRLLRKPERVWLAGVAQKMGARSFTFGGDMWLFVHKGENQSLHAIEEALRERYGALAHFEKAQVDDDFVLTPAILTGAKAMPKQVQSAMKRLRG